MFKIYGLEEILNDCEKTKRFRANTRKKIL